MSTPKRFRVPNRRLVSNFRQLPKRFMAGLLRLVFISARFGRTRQAGFVLPTTVLLLLIVSLTAGSLSFRAFSRSASVIAEREQKVVYGAATPAIDRAKAKLEYLFDKRVPSNSTPKSSDLEGYLEDDTLFTIPGDPTDPTRGPETRIDINDDGNLDNAWWFAADVNGDGTVDAANERIVYSILVGHEGQAPGTPTNYKLEDKVSEGKADALVTRNGPIDVESSSNACPVSLGTNEEGWQEISVGNPIIKKNFQINAFVVNSSDVNRTVSALEVQQIRESRKGSKWGAWFKNDLEIFPGAAVDFTWNGAMHTEGSLFLRPTNSDFNLRMISSYNSCLYSENASDIELVKDRAPNNYNSQVIAGGLTGTSPGFGGSSTKLDWYNGPTAVGTQAIGTAQDSINAQPANIDDIALDPIKLFTADELDYRRPEGTTWTKQNDAAFWEQPYAKNRIARTEENDPPFLDDIYRADGRFGPKSVYDTSKGLSLSNAQAKLGDLIASKPLNANFTEAQKNEIDSTSAPFEGLDGYWEKQATDKGAKVIVGERLQLGNPFGWKGAYASEQNPNNIGVTDPAYKQRNMDSLYPAYDGGAVANNTINGLSDQSLRLHARSLNDNLAAVQSMAVYHYKTSDSKTFPLACMSSVSHPGTNTTKANARTFNLLPKLSGGALSLASGGTDLVNVDFDGDGNNDVQVDADFFFGYGTNAWEYAPPLGTEAAFATAYNDATHPLKKALKNLAFFAGDPKGGSPSFTPVQGEQGGVDPFIHPYPYLSMWGDYSPLRRILEPAANGGLGDPSYAALSIADKTTLQTAACTLGMLATNIQVADSLDYTNTSVQSALIALAGEIGSTSALTSSDYVPEAYIAAFERSGKDAALGLARLLHIKEQVKRDRTYGFLQTPASHTFSYTLTAPQTIAPGQSLTAGTPVQLSFDPTEAENNYFGFGLPATAPAELRFLQLAAVAGGLGVPGVQVGLPKFPSLYYLFPIAQHDYLGNHPTDSTLSVIQPINEPYIDPDLDGDSATNSYTATSNKIGANLYTYEPLVSADLDAIRAEPRGLITDWTLPYTIDDAAGRPNQISYDINNDGVIAATENVATLFQDKSFMDGREMLNVRTVEVDVALATDADNLQVENKQFNGQSWFTEGEPATSASGAVQGGIFYAFREDARREDELFRPIASTDPLAEWDNCDSTAEILTAACRMNFDVGAEQDPPIRRLTDASGDNFISTKPVDFYPDPERRPYGFRLSNGKTLNRADDVPTGLTFVTDNALYVQGDFNLHTARRAAGPKAVGDPLEEFYTSVDGNGDGEIAKDEFYGDRGDPATDIDTELFAKPDDGDDWRVVELVADATNILSENFKDGVIKDYFLQARGSTDGSAISSYQNVFRVRQPGVFRLGEGGNRFRYRGSNIDKIFQSKYAATTTDAVADPDPLWPFWIRRNGTVDGGLNTAIFIPDSSDIGKDRPKDLIAAKETTVNALLIGGIIPSRLNLSYGGLHNFPRLNEHWPGHTLNIAGAFYQLNFSTASTGLFEQDINRTGTARGAWEPGVEPTVLDTGGTQYFYGAPGRQWGYDVAFQYNSPGPVSQRFTGNESVRSEYYKDLPADDPYVQNLQCAQNADGTAVIANPTVTCP